MVTQEVQSWLMPKVSTKHRSGLASGEYFQAGVHDLGNGCELAVARADRAEDSSRRLLMRYTESNKTGIWRVTIAAIDYERTSKRGDALLVEAVRMDAPDAPGEVDPPKIVRQLLERVEVHDGLTHVTSAPRLMTLADTVEVFEAITDSDRSVSVIVAASLGPEFDESLRARVTSLTSKVVGLAAVFVLSSEAASRLNELLPQPYAIERGRVRTFLPAVDLTDHEDGRRHRVLGPATFARAIRRTRVDPRLQAAFALETRAALLSRPMPSDVRRGVDLVSDSLARLERELKIEERARAAMLEVPVERAQPTNTPISERVREVLRRWLKREPTSLDADVLELDAFVSKQVATAETILEEAIEVEGKLVAEREGAAYLKLERDELESQIAAAEDESAALRRRVEYLQRELVEVGKYNEAFATLEPELDWGPPESLVELATVLSASTTERHLAFERVEFCGSIDAVQDAQKRDLVGRYAHAFWEYVQVLYDYVGYRRGGGAAGNVHLYLTDDAISLKKCPPLRHSPFESDTVMKNSAWKAERVFPVPAAVSSTEKALMVAHFRPTHQDTFAPRMHYLDDIANSGKVYIGYIGKHLTNSKTKNS
jgi:hypothetical protein